MSEPNGETYKIGSGGRVGRGSETRGNAPAARLNRESLAQWAGFSSQLNLNPECLACSRTICGRCVTLEALELDYYLVVQAQSAATGAKVHRFNEAITVYMGSVELWNQVLQQHPLNVCELREKMVLRDRALALQAKLRQEVFQAELRSKGFVTDDPAKPRRPVLQLAGC
jgi:hypothetical protein